MQTYFERFGFCGRQIAAPPRPDLGLVVTMPCFNEPDLTGALESLWACERPNCAVEVIVVVNSPAECAVEVRRQNQQTLAEAAAWAAAHADPRLAFHLLHFPELPPRQAGVGLARKIGMDEALRRFEDLGKPWEGIIAGYDADCRCEPNYLSSLARHFQQHPRSPGCSIYFEHPLSGPLEPNIYEAAAAYELHLRYYVQALRWTGFPYAHHTIGSCMAVRVEAYKMQGGMNRRQAGEDFYFLHKIFPLGGFTELNETTVRPSPRPSDRVPFGTGKAVRASLAGEREPGTTYPFEAFADLKAFFDQLPALWSNPEAAQLPADDWPKPIRTFLEAQGFAAALEEIRANTTTEAAFRKRLFGWFNGFQAMKFIHHARDQFHGERAVRQEAARLLAQLDGRGQPPAERSVPQLLEIFRELARTPLAK